MTQMTFAEAEFANKMRKPRCEIFLERMEALIPWTELERKLRKHYPRGENGRRYGSTLAGRVPLPDMNFQSKSRYPLR